MPIEQTGRVLPGFARLFCAAAALAIGLELFYLGSKPFAGALFPPHWDKLAHIIVYGLITALLLLATGGRRATLVVVAVIALGALDEIHQRSLPGRSADVLDFLADVIACVGVGWRAHLFHAARSTLL
jgi:VanZ family protein